MMQWPTLVVLSRQTALEIIQIQASRSVKGSLANRSLVQMERDTEKLPALLLSCMFMSDVVLSVGRI
jgi:putative methionine-R-sulfoxide reductase with GAF domain